MGLFLFIFGTVIRYHVLMIGMFVLIVMNGWILFILGTATMNAHKYVLVLCQNRLVMSILL